MYITENAMLSEVKISMWQATKTDRAASDDLNNDASAVRNASSVRKHLLVGARALKIISDVGIAARKYHNATTLPWSDDGPRLTPVTLWYKYNSKMHTFQQEFEKRVDDFLQEYPLLVKEARNNLGDLFNIDDYPHPSDVCKKFAFSIKYMPIPTSADFRLNTDDSVVQKLKADYATEFQDRLNEAMREPWKRIKVMIENMTQKLEPTEDEKGKRYHATLLQNAFDLCDLLSGFNILGDPDLSAVENKLRAAIGGVDIEDIRKDANTRADVKIKLEAILAEYDF